MSASPWPRRLTAMGLGFFLLILIELSIRMSGIAEGNRYAPRKLIQIYEKGELKGELLAAQGPVFDRLNTGMIETKRDYYQGDGQGFPHSGSMRRSIFSATPQEGVDRYFLLGGSAALGQQPVNLKGHAKWPTIQLGNQVAALAPELSISGRIESRLKQNGLNVEVINAGMIAQDSGGVRRIAKEVLQYEPKGLLLYLGNNEGIGMASEMNGTELPKAPEVRSVLRKSHIYRLLSDWMMPKPTTRKQAPLTGTAPDVLGNLIQTQWRAAGKALFEENIPTDSVHSAIDKRLESNLRAIVKMAEKTGVSVTIIPTPPHLGYPPFYSANDPELSERDIFAYSDRMGQAQEQYENKEWQQLADNLSLALDIERRHAKGWQLYGEALNGLGQHREAKRALERALNLDLSKKRAALSFAGRSEKVCKEEGCTSIDAHAALSEHWSRSGLAIYDQFWGDHEHLTPKGCDFIAELFTDAISRP